MKFIHAWIGKLNIWPQVALAISIGFLLQYVAFSLLGERAVQDSSQRILEGRLLVAQMAASQIDQWLQEEIDELEQTNIRAKFDLQDPNLAAEADLLAYSHKNLGEFSPGFTLLNPDGQVLLSRPADLYLPNTDLSDLPHIVAALERRQATISAPFNDPLANRPVTALTIPVYDGDRFKGLLSGLVSFDRAEVLDPLLAAKTLDLSAHAVLVDSEGRALASTFGLPFLSPGEHFTFYRRALTMGKPVVETVPFELDLPNEPKDHLHVMAFAPLQGATWGVAVGGDVDETFAAVDRLRTGLAVIGIIALVAIWGGTLIGTRRLVRPIQYMTRAAQQIALGDLQTPIRVSGENETQIMASALENMRIQLLGNIEEITNWNHTLEVQVDEQTADLRQQQELTRRLLRQIITSQEEERTRISRELHDELGQILTAIEINLDRLGNTLPAEAGDSQTRLEQVRLLTDEAMSELRLIIVAMRPGVLDKLGLIPALDWIAKQTLRPLEIEVKIETDERIGRLPDEIETTIFRIAQEAINNIARHSHAQQVEIHLEREMGNIRFTISDDGKGWDQTETMTTADDKNIGLASMHERALFVGGQLEIESNPGLGTIIKVITPVTSEGEEQEYDDPTH